MKPFKGTAHIDDWRIINTGPIFSNDKCLIGRIKDHPDQDHFHYDLQITSRLISLDRVNKTAETINTIYTLGKEYHEQ